MAVTASARSALGARSVSLAVTVVGNNGADNVISHAQLIADASAVELKSLAIYKDFLNKKFLDDSDVADAALAFDAAGALGSAVSLVSDADMGYTYIGSWNVDADGYPTFTMYPENNGKASLRISLASSIAA